MTNSSPSSILPSPTLSILLIEDDPYACRVLGDYFRRAGHGIVTVGLAEEGLDALRREIFDVVLVDLKLPRMSGMDFLREIQGEDPPPVIVVTADTEIDSVVAAMKAGAADYVTKPLTVKNLPRVLTRAVEISRLRRHVDLLEREAHGDPDPLVSAHSPAMLRTLDIVRRAGSSANTPVLLVGESGVGKEVLAAYLHRNSPRARGPLVRINVAAIPESMMEAELFGHVRGAFTDARQARQGFFHAAQNGTLLLDEVAEMKPELQAKLLRVIETRQFYPVGTTREVVADVRIVAATNRDPAEALASGHLRPDLFYRLSTMLIRVPALRERREDIETLARSILTAVRRQTRRGPRELSREALDALESYPWPGNVRELRNAVERIAILCDQDVVSRDDLENFGIFLGAAPGVRASSPSPSPLPAALTAPLPAAPLSPVPPPGAAPTAPPPGERASSPNPTPLTLDVIGRHAAEEAERRAIVDALARTQGNRTRAAELLHVSRSTLWLKMQRYGIEGEP